MVRCRARGAIALGQTAIPCARFGGVCHRRVRINVSAMDAISAATATVTDVRSFCERQPEACTLGSRAAVAIGQRAQAGAKMVYEYLNEHLASHEAGTQLDGVSPDAVPLPVPRPPQHTLSPPDLGSPWRSPQSPNQVRGDGPTLTHFRNAA